MECDISCLEKPRSDFQKPLKCKLLTRNGAETEDNGTEAEEVVHDIAESEAMVGAVVVGWRSKRKN